MGEAILAPMYSTSDSQFSAMKAGLSRDDPCHNVPASAKRTEDACQIRVFGWNLGGTALEQLKPALGDVSRGPLRPDDLLLLQEVPRSSLGWTTARVEGRLVVHYRDKTQWRGTGISVNDSSWSIQKKISAGAGCWFRLKGLQTGVELWCGTFQLSPGTSLVDFEASLNRFLDKKPTTTLPIIVQGDVNAHFRWEQGPRGDTSVSTEGRSLLFRDRFLASGLHMVAPVRSQQSLPTSRPRQAGRGGHHIDVIAVQRVLRAKTEIMVESFKMIGTDHEALFCDVLLRQGKAHRRHATGPRVWIGGVSQLQHVDQDVLERLAKHHTKPRPGQAYKDSAEVKAAYKQARQLKAIGDLFASANLAGQWDGKWSTPLRRYRTLTLQSMNIWKGSIRGRIFACTRTMGVQGWLSRKKSCRQLWQD